MGRRVLWGFLAALFAGWSSGCGKTGPGDDSRIDLVLSSVSAPLSAEAGATVFVSNAVENGGTEEAGSFRVGIYLSADAEVTASDTAIGWRAVSALSGGGSRSADTPATIPRGTPAGSYYIGAIADDRDAVAETDETNNALASAAAFEVVAVELAMTALSGPGSANPGQDIVLDNTVENTGGVDAGGFRVSFYLSTNETITDRDVLLGSRVIAGLNASQSDVDSTTVTVPAGTQEETYYIGAIVDDLGEVEESDETNNVFVSAGMIDIGTTPGWDAYEPDNEADGATDTVIDDPPQDHTFHNGDDRDWLAIDISSGATVVVETSALSVGCNTYLVLYAADGTTVLAEDNNGGSEALASRIVWTFPGPDTCYVEVKPFMAPAGNAGDYTVAVTAFAGGADVDLVAQGVNVWGGLVLAGETIQMALSVQNGGTDDCTPFRLGVYLSDDATITAGDTLLHSEVVPGLLAGETYGTFLTVTIPSATPSGDYRVGIIADDLLEVTETEEANNALAAAAPTGVDPDVAVTAVSCPASAAEGETIDVVNTVRNNGGCALSNVQVRFYLSRDAVIDPETDLYLTMRTIPGPLAGGADDTATTAVTLPATMDSGTWHVGVVASLPPVMIDPAPETDTSNNVLAGTVDVTGTGLPDLIMTDVSVSPIVVAPGGDVDAANTIENVGSVTTGAVTDVTFYLATDPEAAFGPSWQIGIRAVPVLAGAASDSETTALTLPGGVPGGSFYFVARADAGANDVVELNEQNNTLAAEEFLSVDGSDMNEPGNDTMAGAGFLAPWMQYPMPHTFHASGDVDWFRLNMMMPGLHTVETSNLRLGADTVIEIFRLGEETPFLVDDDGGAEPGASRLTFELEPAAQYFVRVTHAMGGTGHYGIQFRMGQ